MDDNKKAVRRSVPQFGGWDLKCGVPDYSTDFSKIRESRMQDKKDFWRSNVGNEEELITPHHDYDHLHEQQQQEEQQQEQLPIHPPNRKQRILSYFSCCIKASPLCKCGRVL